MNYKVIIHTLGWVLIFEAASMLLPLVCALIYGESCVSVFLLCMGICLACGLLFNSVRPKTKTMYAKEGYIIVALSWIFISVFGALPFVFSETIPSFVNALFETVSGFTTTGASVIHDLSVIPKGILFWRSFTHWIGGMGVLVFLVAILPLSGGNNLFLIKAESPGPAVSKLVPKISSTAKILYGIYLLFTVMEITLLLLGGMSFFDSLTITFGTAGTGGFAVRNSSMAEYSPYLQNVVTIFMIIFGVDFSLYYLILLKKFKLAFRSDEFRSYIGILLFAIIVITINCRFMFVGFGETVRHSAFQAASVMTTTGFSTTDFDRWPELSKTILVTLMFIGACAGSTGGGIKVSRIIILLKSIVKEIKITAHPKATHKITMNGRPIEHVTVRAVNVFMASYLLIFVLSVLIISIDNLSFSSNFTAVAATLNNIGPGLSEVGPTRNFSVYSPLSTVVLTADMLIGRLEIFPILILFSPSTWKK